MNGTTSILELPTTTEIKNQVRLETREMGKKPNSPPPQILSNKDAETMVKQLQKASNEKVTSLPTRDMPMNTARIVQDPRVKPNYIPPPLREQAARTAAQREEMTDYIKQHDTMHDIVKQNKEKEEKLSSLDILYNEIQTPLFVMVLFFIFQMPFFQKMMIKFLPSLFSQDGHPTFVGFLIKTLLFGLSFYGIQKGTILLSEI